VEALQAQLDEVLPDWTVTQITGTVRSEALASELGAHGVMLVLWADPPRPM
jgi:hypothetical protein